MQRIETEKVGTAKQSSYKYVQRMETMKQSEPWSSLGSQSYHIGGETRHNGNLIFKLNLTLKAMVNHPITQTTAEVRMWRSSCIPYNTRGCDYISMPLLWLISSGKEQSNLASEAIQCTDIWLALIGVIQKSSKGDITNICLHMLRVLGGG